jgi:hypothetical protein
VRFGFERVALAWVVLAVAVVPCAARQDSPPPPDPAGATGPAAPGLAPQPTPGLTPGQLEALVAPVALFPDPLLGSTLMCATMVGNESGSQARRALATHLLTPPHGGIGLLNWKAHDRAVENGYRYALEYFGRQPQRGA